MYYKILKFADPEKLEQAVQAAIIQGWKPQGGIAVAQSDYHSEQQGYSQDNFSIVFVQAIVTAPSLREIGTMKTLIHKIETGEEPKYPCWLYLPECSEWQWYEKPMPADYTRIVMSHWSPGGRPEAPRGALEYDYRTHPQTT